MLPGVSTSITLRCRCGTVRGVARDVSPETSNHLFCYCDDCQAYGRWLGAPGVLDPLGGTELLQLTPSQVTFRTGIEQLRCMRLYEGGMLRWYTGCCRTPAGNMFPPHRMPFVALMPVFMDHAADGHTPEILGPVLARCFGRFAHGGAAPDAHPKVPAALLLRSARVFGGAFFAGKARPSPYRDASGAPISTPQVLTPAERQRLRDEGAPAIVVVTTPQ
jgi:hypothetical protein